MEKTRSEEFITDLADKCTELTSNMALGKEKIDFKVIEQRVRETLSFEELVYLSSCMLEEGVQRMSRISPLIDILKEVLKERGDE